MSWHFPAVVFMYEIRNVKHLVDPGRLLSLFNWRKTISVSTGRYKTCLRPNLVSALVICICICPSYYDG